MVEKQGKKGTCGNSTYIRTWVVFRSWFCCFLKKAFAGVCKASIFPVVSKFNFFRKSSYKCVLDGLGMV